MSVHTDPQIILKDGQPAFAVIPWDEYQELVADFDNNESDVWLPNEVVKAVAIDGVSVIKAWREHFGFTQKELAAKSGMEQSALARVERIGTNPRKSTLKKLAVAFGIDVEQLTV